MCHLLKSSHLGQILSNSHAKSTVLGVLGDEKTLASGFQCVWRVKTYSYENDEWAKGEIQEVFLWKGLNWYSWGQILPTDWAKLYCVFLGLRGILNRVLITESLAFLGWFTEIA